MSAPRLGGNILRLCLIGIGTVLGVMLLIVLWATVVEGTDDIQMALTYGMLVAGPVIIFAAAPSFVLWYLAAWLLSLTALAPRHVPVIASAITAVTGAIVITWALASFDSSIAGRTGAVVLATLAGLSAAVAALLTAILFQRPEEASRP